MLNVFNLSELENLMGFDPNKLSLAVRTALSMGAVVAMGLAGSVHAQDQAAPPPPKQSEAKTLNAVVVTGSHIRRVDLETSNPVVTVSAAQIEATGKQTLGDVVQNLPAITGGLLTPTVNNHNSPGAVPAGRTLAGLRGLGSNRTLLLVDGQRVLNTDLNSIPAAAVERIEVLTDGASSVYGSDAIGGVINVILKSNYKGAQVSVNYGESSRGDGQRRGGSFVFGESTEKASLFAGLSYNRMDIVVQGDRKFSQSALSLTSSSDPTGPLSVVPGGSTNGRYGKITLPANIAAQFGCPNGTRLAANHDAVTSGKAVLGAGDFHCFGADDRYNYATVQALVAPQERLNAFFKGTYHLGDHVDAYMTTYFNKSTASLQLAPNIYGVSADQPISAQSYYNPFGIDFTGDNGNAVAFREIAGGNRVSSASQNTTQLQAGLKGSLEILQKDWTWDAGVNYGYYTFTSSSTGSPSGSLLAAGVGPSFLNSDGVVQCGTPSAPISLDSCVPWNPFNGESPSAKAALQKANTATLIQQWTLQRQFHLDVSGGLIDLPAGTVQLAAGLNYRNEYTNNTIPFEQLIDPTTGNCPGAGCASALRGKDNVKEVYGELFIPILQDMPFAKSLNLTLGDRYSKYDLAGSTNNWKVAFEWKPINDLLLRGTVATVFRAPSIADIFGLPSSSTSSLSSDPCDGATTPNPACQYVPLDGTFRNQTVATHDQGNGLFSGSKYLNFPLKPEQGKSFNFGAVYSPEFIPNLSLSLDYWRIYLNDTITIPGEQTVLDLCYNGIDAYCPLIHRYSGGGSVGQIQRVFLPTTNLGRLDVKGTDFSGSYRLPDFGWGKFTVLANVTYMTQYQVQIAPGTDANRVFEGAGVMGGLGSGLQSACPDNIGGLCFFPRWTAQASANWQLGNWDASWRFRATDKFNMGSADLSQQSTAYPGRPGVVFHYGTHAYSDVTLGYNIKPYNTKVEFGVNNLFDKQPPLLYANNSLNANTDPADFDVLGRYFWGRVTVSF
ncbi:MAG TPA: TonB-dependent receptor [Rhodanobacter sp.]|nr:TonB-dependent receptor [Rhodanobacter sp.]